MSGWLLVGRNLIGVLVLLAVAAMGRGDFQPFEDPFDYTVGGLLSDESGGAWFTNSGSLSYEVVAGPNGSDSGANVISPNGVGNISVDNRLFGTVDDLTPIDLRFSVYTGAPAGNNDLYMLVQNSSTPFNNNNKNISFEFGVFDGKIRANRGTSDTVSDNAVIGGLASANTWYEFRALYIPADGFTGGSSHLNADVIDLSYRTLPGGDWVPHTQYFLTAANSNELSTSDDNLFSMAGRNWTGAQVMSADDASVQLATAEPGRGHRILSERGLQIQALAFPDDAGGPGGTGSFDLSRFADSNFTTVNLHRTPDLVPQYLGAAPGIPWARWADTMANQQHLLTAAERPYAGNLVSSQWRDEQSITDPEELERARQTLAIWRAHYPDMIGYTNQAGGQNNVAELQNWVSYVKPDMVSFDNYPFNGSSPLVGGSPTAFYEDLQTWRQLGLGGHDGTGQNPIPYGLYLQTWKLDGHDPSESEMRLNQFAAWAFGYTFANAFVYSKPTTAQPIDSSLFSGYGDSNPLPGFDYVAETNRQSRTLGPALVHLLSSDVRIILGQHGSPGSPVSNAQPAGVDLWHASADPFITSIIATNLGSLNNGLRGDVLVGYFQPLLESDGDDLLFMIVNGLSDSAGTATNTSQQITLNFNFGTSGINNLYRLSRDSGLVELVTLVHDGGSLYHLELVLPGGTGDLFGYHPSFPGFSLLGDFNLDGIISGLDIQGFIDAFTNETQYKSDHGLNDVEFLMIADINRDTLFSGLDIDPFVDLLTGGGASANQLALLRGIPEPGGLALLVIGILILTHHRRVES